MKLTTESRFYRKVLAIAVPIALQNLITFSTSMMDTLMLGRADDTGVLLSASSLANQPFFILSMVCFGLAGAATVLSAQYWGKKNLDAIRTIFSMILRVAALFSVCFAATVLLLPEWVMGLYSDQSQVIARGAEYLRIIGWAYLLYGMSNTMICCLRCVEAVKISVVVNTLSFFTNVSLNWVLIFGNLGAPALGIRGAAIATLIARLVEFSVTFWYTFRMERRLAFRIHHLLRWNGKLGVDLLRFGSPVFVNETMWSLAITLQAAILGHISYSVGDPVAANSIASMIQQMATVAIFGLANAAAVLVGKSIGEGKKEQAVQQAHTFTVLGGVMGVLSLVLILLIRRPVVEFYDIPASTKELAYDMLGVISVVTFFVSMATIFIVGVLRGAGDTRFCLSLEMICLWLVALPAAYAGAYLWEIPVVWVLALMKVDELLKTFCCLIRVRSGKWIKQVTREEL